MSAKSVILNSEAWVPVDLISAPIMANIEHDLSIFNVTKQKAAAAGYSRKEEDDGTPDYFVLWRRRGKYVVVPRAYYFDSLRPRLQKFLGSDLVEQRNVSSWGELPNGFPECTITLRPKQVPAYEAAMAYGGGTIQLACGLGKTPTALRMAADIGKPTLIVVNTNVLLDQWRREILEETSQHPKFFPSLTPADVGHIQQNICDFEGKPFTLAMIHTLAVRDFSTAFYRYFGTIIYDECHNLSTNYFYKVGHRFWGIRIGLSASAKREDTMDRMFTYHIGKVVHVNLTQDLKPEVFLMPSGIKWEDLDDRGKQAFKMWNHPHKINFSKLVTRISLSPEFNDKIIALLGSAAKKGRKILVLGERVAQLEYLHETWTEMSEFSTGLIIGKKTQDERRLALDSAVVFATSKLAEEGLDCPEFDTLIIIIPKSSKKFMQQAAGRILRSVEGKDTPVICIFTYDHLNCSEMEYLQRNVKSNLNSLGFSFKKGK